MSPTSGASARAETMSAACGASISALSAITVAGSAASRTTVARRAALRSSLLDQPDLEARRFLRRDRSDHQPREAAAGAEIDPDPAVVRSQPPELRQIGDVP